MELWMHWKEIDAIKQNVGQSSVCVNEPKPKRKMSIHLIINNASTFEFYLWYCGVLSHCLGFIKMGVEIRNPQGLH